MDESFDLVSSLMAYEEGELPEDRVVELFQYLLDHDLSYSLQGSYGRMTEFLLESGKIHE